MASACLEVSNVAIDPETMLLTGIGTGENATHWRVVRVSDGVIMDSGLGTTASFSFEAEYDTEYQLQFCVSSLPVPTITTWEQGPWDKRANLGLLADIGEPLTFRLVVWTGSEFIELSSSYSEVAWEDMVDVRDFPSALVPSDIWKTPTVSCELSAEDIALIKANGNTVYYQALTGTGWRTWGDIVDYPERHPCGALSGAYALEEELQNLRVDFFIYYDSIYHSLGYTVLANLSYFWPNVGFYPYPDAEYMDYGYVSGKTGTAIRLPGYFRRPCPNGYAFWNGSERYYGSFAVGSAAASGNGTPISIGGWVKIDGATGYGATGIGSIACLPWNLQLLPYDETNFKIWLYNNPLTVNEYEAAVLSYGVDHLVYLTYDDVTVRLYCDNVLMFSADAEADYEGNPPRSSTLTISSYSYITGADHLKYALLYFCGMERHQSCLSESELDALWNDGEGVPSEETLVCSIDGCVFSVSPPPADISGKPQIINPYVMLQWSDDGGQTWSNEYWRNPGRIGEFRRRLVWRQLGRAKDRVYRIAVSDPCKWIFVDAWVEAEVGTTRR